MVGQKFVDVFLRGGSGIFCFWGLLEAYSNSLSRVGAAWGTADMRAATSSWSGGGRVWSHCIESSEVVK